MPYTREMDFVNPHEFTFPVIQPFYYNDDFFTNIMWEFNMEKENFNMRLYSKKLDIPWVDCSSLTLRNLILKESEKVCDNFKMLFEEIARPDYHYDTIRKMLKILSEVGPVEYIIEVPRGRSNYRPFTISGPTSLLRSIFYFPISGFLDSFLNPEEIKKIAKSHIEMLDKELEKLREIEKKEREKYLLETGDGLQMFDGDTLNEFVIKENPFLHLHHSLKCLSETHTNDIVEIMHPQKFGNKKYCGKKYF